MSEVFDELGKTSYQMIDVKKLKVNSSYQRELSYALAKKISLEFDPFIFGALHVVQDENGSYAVVDGQTRLAASQLLDNPPTKVPVLIHTHLPSSAQAKLFSRMNKDRKMVNAIALFKADVVSGNIAVNEIKKILDRHELRVTPGGSSSHSQGLSHVISSVTTLRSAYDTFGGEVINESLYVYQRGFTFNQPVRKDLLAGIILIISAYTPEELPREDLWEVLRQMRKETWLARAKHHAQEMHSRFLPSVANTILDVYNQQVSKDRKVKLFDRKISSFISSKKLKIAKITRDPITCRIIRIQHGFSIKEIADLIGCNSSGLSAWERGLSVPKITYGAKWMEILDQIEAKKLHPTRSRSASVGRK